MPRSSLKRLSAAAVAATLAAAGLAGVLPATAQAHHPNCKRGSHRHGHKCVRNRVLTLHRHHRRHHRHHRHHHHVPPPPNPATVLQGELRAVPFGPYGLKARHFDGDAHLVAGPSNQQLSVHARGLQPVTTYSFALVSNIAGSHICAATATKQPVTAFTYPPLTTNPSGKASAHTTSTTFSVNSGLVYAVVIRDSQQNIIACGALHRNGNH